MKEKTEYDSRPNFIPIIKWYETLQDLEFRYIDYGIEENIRGMTTIYYFYYSKVKHYIKGSFNNTDDNLLKLDDIFALQTQLKEEKTDGMIMHNNKIYNEIKQRMFDKWSRLNELLSEAQILLPLRELKDISKAVFEM